MIAGLVVIEPQETQTTLYPMQFSTGNQFLVSRSHENDAFASKNAPEVMFCAGTGEPAHKIARDRISQGIRSRVGL